MNTISKLQEIIKEILDDESLEITLDSVREDFEEWDSLAQIQILSEIERRFNFKFLTQEVMSLKSVSDFAAAIEKRGNV